MKKAVLKIVAYTKPQTAARFQYLISRNGKPYKAFTTTNGYINFLKRMNLTVLIDDTLHSPRKGEVKLLSAYGDLTHETFSDVSEVPAEATMYLDFLEGSLVEHYYLHTDGGVILYAPLVYHKEVFKPYPLSVVNEHLEFNG